MRSADSFEALEDELGALRSERHKLEEELKRLSRREYYEERYIKCGNYILIYLKLKANNTQDMLGYTAGF